MIDLLRLLFANTISIFIILLIITIGISVLMKFYYPDKNLLSLVLFFISLNRVISLIAAVYAASMEKELDYKKLTLSRNVINVFSSIIT